MAGKVTIQVTAHAGECYDPGWLRNAVGGYVIVRAETHAEATALFKGHPHFTIFPGESVEVMECLPIPGQ